MLFIFDENFRYVELLLRNVVELMPERNLIHIDARLLHARVPHIHRLINYIDTKMSSSKKNYKRDFVADAYLSEAPSPPMTPYPSSPHTLRTCIQYTYSHREGGGGGLTTGKVRGTTVHKAGSKIPT